jgi:hypothetical protein
MTGSGGRRALVLPVVFLGAPRRRAGSGVEPYAARWVRVWTIVFALASIADRSRPGLAMPLLPFVLLGDYRSSAGAGDTGRAREASSPGGGLDAAVPLSPTVPSG